MIQKVYENISFPFIEKFIKVYDNQDKFLFLTEFINGINLMDLAAKEGIFKIE